MSRDADVARVLSMNVREHIEPDRDGELPVLAMEPLRAGPVDGAGKVGAGAREADGDPLRMVDRRRDPQRRVLPARGPARDDVPGRCSDRRGESSARPSRKDESRDCRASGKPQTNHPPKHLNPVVTALAARFNSRSGLQLSNSTAAQ